MNLIISMYIICSLHQSLVQKRNSNNCHMLEIYNTPHHFLFNTPIFKVVTPGISSTCRSLAAPFIFLMNFTRSITISLLILIFINSKRTHPSLCDPHKPQKSYFLLLEILQPPQPFQSLVYFSKVTTCKNVAVDASQILSVLSKLNNTISDNLF